MYTYIIMRCIYQGIPNLPSGLGDAMSHLETSKTPYFDSKEFGKTMFNR